MDALIALMRDDLLVGVMALGATVDQALLPGGVLRDLYFLAEPLANAVERIWAHERVAANHGMMTDILRELTSACVVVGKDLRILHANASANALFKSTVDGPAELNFSDLPEDLAGRVYQVLKAGAPMTPFRYRFQDKLNRLFLASVIPFQSKDALLPSSALLVLEDRTQSEQIKRLEVEAANLRLVRTMADRLAHEIGNALVPISTHQQLLPTRHKDPEFRVSLENALASGVKRIGRLVNQMVFLAHDHPMSMESLPLAPLIEEAFKEAQRHLPIQTATLRQSNESATAVVIGDRPALRHALTEVFINAMQANPADAKVAARTAELQAEHGVRWMQIEILDNGDGFVADAAGQVTEPFFTTRSVGLGLGLAVTRKVLEAHQGRLEIQASEGGHGGCVSLFLPLNPLPG
ncbi:MAG: hypothetical protein HY299_03305 [Verrucomicrobia bacterium]|nr:hypothetical protein [Verrucomicrobiota bacterium]